MGNTDKLNLTKFLLNTFKRILYEILSGSNATEKDAFSIEILILFSSTPLIFVINFRIFNLVSKSETILPWNPIKNNDKEKISAYLFRS